MTIPYEFQRYKQFSLQFYTILMRHADDLQAVSVDEALLDVSSRVALNLPEGKSVAEAAEDLARLIQTKVMEATSCTGRLAISSVSAQ